MKKISLKMKLIRLFIITSLLPIVILGAYSYINISKTLRENTETMSKSSLRQVDNNLNISIESYKDVMYQIYTADEMVTWVNNLDSGIDEAVTVNQMRRFLGSLLYSKDYIRSVSVITPKKKMVSYEQLTPATYKSSWIENFSMTEKELYKDVARDYHTHIYSTEYATKFANKDYYLFHIAHRIIDYKNLEKECGIVIISVDEDFLKEICYAPNEEGNVFYFIVDEKGRVASFGDKETALGTEVTSMDLPTEERIQNYKDFLKKSDETFSNNSAIYLYHDEKLGWDIVNVTSLSKLTKSLSRQMSLILIIGVAVMTVAIILSTGLSENIVSSIKRIISKMEKVQKGDLSVRVEKGDTMPLEIETIADGLNDMLEKLNHALTRQQEAQIAALEAQINPHFLYNTLDTINWMAIDKDQYDISNAISALANILRYAIVNSNSEVTVLDEMDWLKKYVYLQQYRVKGQFSYSCEVSEEAKNALIHKLLLQPFVENAIKHGFAQDQSDAVLKVMAECENDRLIITIEDNGKGMDEEAIRAINQREYLNPEKKTNIGIKNVATRLEMYYSDLGKIEAKTDVLKGTAIVVSIPLKKKQD